VPGNSHDACLPNPTAREVLAKMEHRAALKDAEIQHLVEPHAATLSRVRELEYEALHGPCAGARADVA
jgi:hypothetical protein